MGTAICWLVENRFVLICISSRRWFFFFWRHTQQASQKQFGTLHTNSRIPHETTALKLLKPNYKHSYSKLAMCGAGKKKKLGIARDENRGVTSTEAELHLPN